MLLTVQVFKKVLQEEWVYDPREAYDALAQLLASQLLYEELGVH